MDVNCPTWGFVSPKSSVDLLAYLELGVVHLQILLGKSGEPGAGEHVHGGLLNIIAASQGKKLFVYAIYKVNLSPTME